MILHQGSTHITYDQLCLMIDQWKSLLVEQYRAEPGQRCIIEFVIPDAHYYSAVFAAFELGLIVISEWPDAFDETDVTSHRMTMHGRINFAIIHAGQTYPAHAYYNYWNLRRTTANADHIITNVDFDNHQSKRLDYPILATPDMDAAWTASGGTLGPARQCRNSHNKILVHSRRLIKLLNFDHNDHVLHIQNLLYGGGVHTYFLTAWMTAQEHSVMVTDDATKIAQAVIDLGITKMQLHTQKLTAEYLESTQPLAHNLDIMAFSNLSPYLTNLTKLKNIHSIKSMFGDAMIGPAMFIKTADKNSVDRPTAWVGPPVDNFYNFEIRDGQLWIEAPALNEPWKTSGDRFECVGGEYYFYGRANQYRIGRETVVLGDLDLEVDRLFSGGATIVIDELNEKIYLAIWKPNDTAEAELYTYFSKKYQHLKIDQIARNLDPNRFIVSRKIDRDKLREYFRHYHLKPVAV